MKAAVAAFDELMTATEAAGACGFRGRHARQEFSAYVRGLEQDGRPTLSAGRRYRGNRTFYLRSSVSHHVREEMSRVRTVRNAIDVANEG